MHVEIMRTRAFPALLRAYGLALAPVLAAAVGAIALLEINYRRATQPEAGPEMKLFWLSFDTSTAWPWLLAIALLVAGALAFRRCLPRLRDAWRLAGEEARALTGASR